MYNSQRTSNPHIYAVLNKLTSFICLYACTNGPDKHYIINHKTPSLHTQLKKYDDSVRLTPEHVPYEVITKKNYCSVGL